MSSRRSAPPTAENNGTSACRTLRFLVVDDHAVVRHGLREILAKGFRGAIFGEASSAPQMLQQVWEHPWDAVTMDVTMPGRSGLDALSELKRDRPDLPVLVLSMHGEDQYAIRALRAGAAAYLTKDRAPEELVAAMTCVLEGRRYVSLSLAEKLASEVAGGRERLPHDTLSERELQVLCMLARARTIKEIAAELSLSVKTVSTYHVRLLEKMKMTRDAELVRYAVNHRLVE
jgi:two-component system invasion response regulator UvrY